MIHSFRNLTLENLEDEDERIEGNKSKYFPQYICPSNKMKQDQFGEWMDSIERLDAYVSNKPINVLCFVVVAFSACLQMAPSSPKKKTRAKKADKRMKMDHNLFRSVSHFERYKNFFLKAVIIQERYVNLEDLRDIFIPNFFEGRGWEKLLSDLPVVCEPLIREFYSNAVIREDELSCWVRGTEFTLDAHDIDDVLGLEGLEDHDSINYKDRMIFIETI